MTQNEKIALIAKLFTKQRFEGDPQLSILFQLDDKWAEYYNHSKRTLSFSESSIIANTRILELILSDEFSI